MPLQDAVAVDTALDGCVCLMGELNGRLWAIKDRLRGAVTRLNGGMGEDGCEASTSPTSAGAIGALRERLTYGHEHALELEGLMSILEQLV